MLTARTEEVDLILGLEVGADDYISKPFSIRQVLARVRAILRRVELDSQSLAVTSDALPGETPPETSLIASSRGSPPLLPPDNAARASSFAQSAGAAPLLPPDNDARASSFAQSAGAAPLVRGSLHIHFAERSVRLDGQEIELTPKEYDLLVLLASHPGWVFKREILLQQIWGDSYEGFDRTIDNHMTRLRKKLGPLGEKIDTVWGVGYRFVE
jgi:DNA-binding response OmpR family regulator